MIRAGELTRLRARVDTTLTATAIVQRKTSVRDSSGGFTETWATIGTYDCSFFQHQTRPLERERDARVLAIAYWLFRFPAGTEIRNTDRIVVGARSFEVVSAGAASLSLSVQALCQEIT